MAKGKQALKDILPEELIVRTDEEVNVPFWIIDDNYGITVNQYGYELVERKEMMRSVRDEVGNLVSGEVYTTWVFSKSASSFEQAILTYCDKLMSKLVKCKDFRELVKIRLQIQNTVNNSFKIDGLNRDVLSACQTIDAHEELKLKLDEINDLSDKATRQFDDFMEFVKEKRQIIVKNTEGKKHRMPLEND